MKVVGDNKELVFKGLESVRSDWTELAKQFQTELYTRVFEGRDCKEYVLDTIAQLRSGKLDSLLVYKKKLRQPLDAYVKTTPPHVKAARADLSKKYYRGSSIYYVISVNGPVVTSTLGYLLDYDHYINKQLLPIADSILSFQGIQVERLFDNQLTLL